MKKSGFTLIELLAVIVILAIIAIIAVPTILGVVEKAKKGSAESSALGYIDAVEKQTAINLLDNDATKFGDGSYTVSGNTVTSGSTSIQVNVKGSTPTEGCIVISKSKVTDYSLKFGNYVVNPNDGDVSKAQATKGGTISACSDSGNSTDSENNLTTAHISSNQIWDCQRSPAMPTQGFSFTLSGLSNPLDKNWNSWSPQSGNYLQVVFVNGKIRLDEYDADGNKVREFSNEGDLYLLDSERHIYFFNASGTGYALCTDPVEAQKFKASNGGSFPYEGISIVESLD